MNILASYNWIKEYLETDVSPDEFAKLTTNAGNSVDYSHDVAKKFDNMVVGIVKKLLPHPKADRLKVAITDIGGKNVEIVCGGENLKEGQRVVVGLPGAMVRWHGEGELIELTNVKIRGVESHGMICAVEEIGFDKMPAGEKDIWDISDITDAKPGTAIAQALDLNDVVYDIEVTSNRPDCKSIIGQAREGAVVSGGTFTWKPKEIKTKKGNGGFSLEVKEKDLCPKYSAILIEHVKVGPSPWWLQKRLLLAGHRPINNIVDVTNFVLHEYGQPLHTFDADKLQGEKIIVRKAKKGEKFLALDGNAYKLSHDQLVVADAKHAVAVAGVMGGEATATTEETTRVLLECAAFDSVSVRRTSRALNLYSDSQLLFEKGLSTESTGPALARAVELILEVAGGNVASEVLMEEAAVYKPVTLPFDPVAANQLMGIELKEKDMTDILERLGFEVGKAKETNIINHQLSITVPYWRDNDIEASVDFVEEIARVYGYDRFPSVLPSGDIPTGREVEALAWVSRAKNILAGSGLLEVYAYSFVSASQLEHYNLSPKHAIKIKNPLSEDHQFMRPSLVPSMLSIIEQNQSQVTSADLFELAPIYLEKKNDIADQPLRLLLASYGKDGAQVFLRAKGVMERLFRRFGVKDVELKRDADAGLWHAGRSATVYVNKKVVGTIGQISDAVHQAFDLDVPVVLVELNFETLVDQFTLAKSFSPIPSFPAVKRDLAFVVDERVQYEDVAAALEEGSELLESVGLFDVYRGKGVDDGKKSMAIHLLFQSDERTLEAKEVDHELEEMRTVLQKEFSAILRS